MFNLNNLLPGQIKPASSDPRKRFRISAFQVQALEDIFKNNPRPCKEIQEEVAQQLGLPYRTVTIWFQNRRAKAKTAGETLAGHVFQWKPPVISSQPQKQKEKEKPKENLNKIPVAQPQKQKEKEKEKPKENLNKIPVAQPQQPFVSQPDWPYLDSASYISGDFASGDYGFPIDFLGQPQLEPLTIFSPSVASFSTQDSASFYNMNFYSQSLPQFPPQNDPFAMHPAQSSPSLPIRNPNPSTRPTTSAKSCQNDAIFFSMRS